MVPRYILNFSHETLTNAMFSTEQDYFGYRQSRVRVVVEGAYGQSKGRWLTQKKKTTTITTATKGDYHSMTLACIVLHNICIDNHDT